MLREPVSEEGWCVFLVVDHSRPEHGADIPIAHRLVCECEGAVLSHFAGASEKRPERGV